jgi:hypothetical protein
MLLEFLFMHTRCVSSDTSSFCADNQDAALPDWLEHMNGCGIIWACSASQSLAFAVRAALSELTPAGTTLKQDRFLELSTVSPFETCCKDD